MICDRCGKLIDEPYRYWVGSDGVKHEVPTGFHTRETNGGYFADCLRDGEFFVCSPCIMFQLDEETRQQYD